MHSPQLNNSSRKTWGGGGANRVYYGKLENRELQVNAVYGLTQLDGISLKKEFFHSTNSLNQHERKMTEFSIHFYYCIYLL